MIHKFKISFKQQLLVLLPFFTINGVIIFGYYLLFREMSIDGLILLLFSFVFIYSVLPVLLLHLQYLNKNWNATIKIDSDKKMITYEDSKNSFKYSFNDIETLKYYATHGHISKKGSSLWYTFDPYRFYKITFRNQGIIIVTCLMVNDVENTLERLLGVTAERKFRALPFIY